MKIDLSKYSTLIFDCDGVILNSNGIKTKAFRSAALAWGEGEADALVLYHIQNGGISRHLKFKYLLETILPNFNPNRLPGRDGPELEELLDTYANEVKQGLMTCKVAEGLETLRCKTQHARWMIVSGGDQDELRRLFAARELEKLFDSGIFGSPDCKDKILQRELEAGRIIQPALFLGDSCYDHEAATRAGIDFIFISEWTDVANWKSFTDKNQLKTVKSLSSLIA